MDAEHNIIYSNIEIGIHVLHRETISGPTAKMMVKLPRPNSARLGRVEPPDWAGENVGPRSRPVDLTMYKKRH